MSIGSFLPQLHFTIPPVIRAPDFSTDWLSTQLARPQCLFQAVPFRKGWNRIVKRLDPNILRNLAQYWCGAP